MSLFAIQSNTHRMPMPTPGTTARATDRNKNEIGSIRPVRLSPITAPTSKRMRIKYLIRWLEVFRLASTIRLPLRAGLSQLIK